MFRNLPTHLVVLALLLISGCLSAPTNTRTWKLRLTDRTLELEEPVTFSVPVSSIGEKRLATHVEGIVKDNLRDAPFLVEVELDDVDNLSSCSYWKMMHSVLDYLCIGGRVKVHMKTGGAPIEYMYATEYPSGSPEEIINGNFPYRVLGENNYLLMAETYFVINGQRYEHGETLDKELQRCLQKAPLIVFLTPRVKIKEVIVFLQSLNMTSFPLGFLPLPSWER